jgi:hypothetical protein
MEVRADGAAVTSHCAGWPGAASAAATRSSPAAAPSCAGRRPPGPPAPTQRPRTRHEAVRALRPCPTPLPAPAHHIGRAAQLLQAAQPVAAQPQHRHDVRVDQLAQQVGLTAQQAQGESCSSAPVAKRVGGGAAGRSCGALQAQPGAWPVRHGGACACATAALASSRKARRSVRSLSTSGLRLFTAARRLGPPLASSSLCRRRQQAALRLMRAPFLGAHQL